MLIVLKDWLGTFWKVTISPTPKTFLAEAQKGADKFPSALAWLVFFATCLYGFVTIWVAPLPLIAFIAAVLLIPLAVVLLTSAMHFSYQRLFHRKEYLYDKLLYISVAILLPPHFIFAPLSLLLPQTISVFVIYALLLYQIALLVVALKTIARIKYWQALLSVLISVVAGLLVFACSLPLIIGAIGDVQNVAN